MLLVQQSMCAEVPMSRMDAGDEPLMSDGRRRGAANVKQADTDSTSFYHNK
jgi:hypothetical protein